jgi:hypothetical protein
MLHPKTPNRRESATASQAGELMRGARRTLGVAPVKKAAATSDMCATRTPSGIMLVRDCWIPE